MNTTLLQFGLYLNIFVIGVLAAIGARHAWAHFHPQKEEKPHPQAPTIHLDPEVREKLLADAQNKFQAEVNHAAADLHKDLMTTVGQLSAQLDKLGQSIIADEMARYRGDLETLRKQAESCLTNAQAEINNHQNDLKTKLAESHAQLETKLNEEMAAEKERLVAQIDTKLADAVTSFLDETLQHNVDLGAQSAYLLKMLDEHKAELINGVKDEA